MLDTSVLSELRKRRGIDEGVRRWFSGVRRGGDLCISALAVGEIRQGVERLRPRDPRQAEAIEGWLSDIHRIYEGRIVAVNAEDADMWGRLNAPDPLPTIDSLMAAQAISRDLTFVTGNPRDVERTGAKVLDPFER
ncbi:MAG: type II toxin-antitoxin system VapC family toxin [Rubrobacter sp.]|jgi:predicted nucleic acid-binding protein|nr:type II toxin-antitoxin system VapC family toxin [Rubrobacter sp.]